MRRRTERKQQPRPSTAGATCSWDHVCHVCWLISPPVVVPRSSSARCKSQCSCALVLVAARHKFASGLKVCRLRLLEAAYSRRCDTHWSCERLARHMPPCKYPGQIRFIGAALPTQTGPCKDCSLRESSVRTAKHICVIPACMVLCGGCRVEPCSGGRPCAERAWPC